MNTPLLSSAGSSLSHLKTHTNSTDLNLWCYKKTAVFNPSLKLSRRPKTPSPTSTEFILHAAQFMFRNDDSVWLLCPLYERWCGQMQCVRRNEHSAVKPYLQKKKTGNSHVAFGVLSTTSQQYYTTWSSPLLYVEQST